MYSYTFDTETGGLLLTSSPLTYSREPRPVYYREMDILGFDKHWQYEKDDAYPYMWAEGNKYFYRGTLVAKTKGGSLYTHPEVIFFDEQDRLNEPLRFIDIPTMVEKNAKILEDLSQSTIKRIYNSYIDYQEKIDVFYVAFSGGKDSVVLLDLVQKALPHNAFKVIFADTGMEFSDTYENVNDVASDCEKQGIEFYSSKSEFTPEETWRIFGPPSKVARWCCGVHKTSPQIALLRKILGKNDFVGFGFVGVRGSESLSRRAYDYICFSGKQKGQYTCNSILEWNSAEVFLYIYANALHMNKTYKKGNRRAGCLVCPRASNRNEFMNNYCYSSESEKFIDIIRELYHDRFSSLDALEEFIMCGGWKARRNGRDLSNNPNKCIDMDDGTKITITVTDPSSDWEEWIKTMGEVSKDQNGYSVIFNGKTYCFEVKPTDNGYVVSMDKPTATGKARFLKIFKRVFRKASYCVGCQACETNCVNGSIKFVNGKLEISTCIHCHQCHEVEDGCLRFHSLRLPKKQIT